MGIRTSSPLGPVKANPNHPALIGSSASIIAYGNMHRWQINSGFKIGNPTIAGAFNGAATPIGTGATFDGTTNYVDYGTANIPTQEFTFLWGGTFTSIGNFRGLIDCVSGANGWTIFESGTDTLFFSINGYGGATSLSGWTAGQFWHGAVRWKTGGEHAWFRNGVKLSSSSPALTPGTSIASLRIGWQRGGGTVPLAGNLVYGYLIGKWLDDPIITSIHQNPWQVLEDEYEIHFWPAPTGGGITLAVAAASVADALSVPAITQNHQLVVAGASSNSAASNVILSQNHQLAVSSATVYDLVDTVAISVSGSLTLVVAGLNIADAVTTVAITQNHQLAPLAATVSPVTSAIALSQNYQLAPSNLSVADAVGTVSITLSGVTLDISNCIFACLLDTIEIEQEHLFTWTKESAFSSGWTKDSAITNTWS